MSRVTPPWVLKPRSEASSMGIKKIHHADELWPLLDTLGDQQSFFVLEQFVPGDVFHVDGLVNDGEVLFQQAHQYGRPPMSVYHDGGIFLTRALDRHSEQAQALFTLNRQVQGALGMRRGATHTEYQYLSDCEQKHAMEIRTNEACDQPMQFASSYRAGRCCCAKRPSGTL